MQAPGRPARVERRDVRGPPRGRRRPMASEEGAPLGQSGGGGGQGVGLQLLRRKPLSGPSCPGAWAEWSRRRRRRQVEQQSAPGRVQSALGPGMAAAAAAELEALLGGQGWPVPPEGRCESGPPGSSPEPARLRRNACFVVLAVVFNDQGEVLMTQEAKAECRGRWYLPAGRMEPRETAVEALRREVAEETGLRCQPTALLAVEERGPAWIRLVFLARPTGGTLKTLQEADEESLQAQWWNRETPALPLRARDILPLIELAVQYRAKPSHPPTLPVELPCSLICQRLLLACVGPGNALWVLLATAGAPHLPLAASGLSPAEQSNGLLVATQRLLQKCLPQAQAAVQVRGLLGLQHLGREPGHSDGICFNVVAAIGGPGQPPQECPPALQSQAFTWWKVEDEALRDCLLQRLCANAFLPLRS